MTVRAPILFKPGASIADMPVVKVLAVGDSMTQGMTGTKTWRANLFQEGIRQGVHLKFVGPRDDITGPDTIAPSQRVYFDEPQGFSRSHGAQSGSGFLTPALDYTAAGLGWGTHLEIVPAMVTKYQPDVLVLLLGFNDLHLCFVEFENDNTPNRYWTPTLIASMTRSYVARAQTAKGDLDVVWGTIPRTNIGNTKSTNVKKNEMAANVNDRVRSSPLFTSRADGNWEGGGRIRVAEINAAYEPTSHSFDGVHPTLLGEKVMAQEFAMQLFALGYLAEAPKINTIVTPDWFIPELYVSTGAGYTTTFFWDRSRYAVNEVALLIYKTDGSLVKHTGWKAADAAQFGPGNDSPDDSLIDGTFLPAGTYDCTIRMRRGAVNGGNSIETMMTPYSPLKRVEVSYWPVNKV